MNAAIFQAQASQLRQAGMGEMRYWELFPGISLSYSRFHTGPLTMSHDAMPHVLEINYCRSGRLGWDMRGGASVYLGPGDMDVHTLDCCALSAMTLPLGHYEGITLLIDLEQLRRDPPALIRSAGIDGDALRRKLCPDGAPLSLPASDEIAHIFAPLCGLPDRLQLPYHRLKALELLLFLDRLEPGRERRLEQYTAQQVQTIQAVHALLTGELGRRYTIEELSRKFLINTATLKTVFKAVYSQPIGAYMRDYRVRRAMELLRQSGASIADVARQVGYENQGKFTEAFKAVTQMLPSEYRREHRPGR